MKNTKHFNSSVRPGDGFTAPLRVVLHESHSSTKKRPEYVVHTQNMQDGGFFHGSYYRGGDGIINPAYPERSTFEAYAAAMAEYMERCLQLGVDPIPDEGVQAIPAGVPRPALSDEERKELFRLAKQATKAGDVATVRSIRDALRPGGLEHDSDEVHAG